jgi:trehalose synthase
MQRLVLDSRPIRGFAEVLSAADYERLTRTLESLQAVLRRRTLWHVNSTAAGGGVAELLSSLLPYLTDAGIDVRRVVLEGTDEFYGVTKRIHNRLHDRALDDEPLGQSERRTYDEGIRVESEDLTRVVRPGDVVVLHDPQTAGLAPPLARVGARVLWRCHVGVDVAGPVARAAWQFLDAYVKASEAWVFSRAAHVWHGLPRSRVAVIPPCIDALSTKNCALDDSAREAILHVSGLVRSDHVTPSDARFRRLDGTTGVVTRPVDMVEEAALPPDLPFVVQVSRWDRLKDPEGLVQAFVERRPETDDGAHLVLAGPANHGVDDDPESDQTLRDVRRQWDGLPRPIRRRIHLACIPMDDVDENAAVVNALQRSATVVVQKSLAEGFGLTVAEAMWKQKPVIGSRVGGIQDQIVDGESGVLVDPENHRELGRAITELVADRGRAARLGVAARQRVCNAYLPLHHFASELSLLRRILSQ